MNPPHKLIRAEVAVLEEHNIRTSYDPDALKRRAESLKKGQKTPITLAGVTIVDGHLRVSAAKFAGITHLDAIDLGELTPDQIREWQTVHAFHSETLSDFDRAGALKFEKDKGLTGGQIAAKFDIDASTVTKLLSLFDAIPACQEAAKAGQIGLTKWYQVAKSPDQEATLTLLLNGSTRDEVARSVKRAKRSEPTVRTAKIEVPLPSGRAVRVKGAEGEEISLEESAETLKEALKLVNAAIAKSLSARSAQLVWRDVAAAG